MKIAVYSLGCKINQYESSALLDMFLNHGFEKVSFDKLADVYLINTCTVTSRTDYKSRNLIRKAISKKTEKPNVKVIVTGCYSQLENSLKNDFPEIDYILDNNSKSMALNVVLQVKNSCKVDFEKPTSFGHFDELKLQTMQNRSRAFVKVQDGCNFYCAYCAVAYARGNPRSRKPENVIAEISNLAKNGYKEVVLGGINLGLYGVDFDNYNLVNLLTELEKIDDLERIRLSSIEPQLFTDDLISFFKNSKKLAPHFHIPLQTGNDFLLKKMGRHYTINEYKTLINKLLDVNKYTAIGADIITGLPFESDELFEQTCSFIEELNLAYLHVFTYSKRPNTRAEKMPEQVSSQQKKLRTQKLLTISDKKSMLYKNLLCVNNIKLCGFAEKPKNGYSTALSNYWVRIYTQNGAKKGEEFCITPKKVFDDGLI